MSAISFEPAATTLRLPGPRSLGPWGQVRAFRRDMLDFLGQMASTYGDVAAFRLGPHRVVLLNHPDMVRDVLQTHNRNFTKGRPLRLASRLLGDGLLTSEGVVHQQQSRRAQPAFRPANVAGYGNDMVACATRWSDQWQDGTTLDLLTDMVSLSTTIAGKTLFGWQMDPATAGGIGEAVANAMALFSRVSLPFAEQLLHVPLPSTRRFQRAKAHLHGTIDTLIAARRGDSMEHDDLLAMLMRNAPDTEEQLRDEALTLFVTALDTTSLALTWTWYALSQHPAVESTLHDELDTVLKGRLPTAADAEQLPYTRQVFVEAMRLYPPIYAIGREAIDTFSVGSHRVPGGTQVLLSPYLLQRDPRYYSDPDHFLPERWGRTGTPHPPSFSYFPFGGGPRGCLGQSFAMQEGVLILATLASRWRLCLPPGYPVGFRPLINLRPSDVIPMRLERRVVDPT